jgi:soluble lytic murein transglycosylase-like protein
MFFIALLSFFLLLSNSWADKICIKEIDGEIVYTNLCERKVESLSSKKNNINFKQVTTKLSSYTKEQLEKIVEKKSNKYGLDAKLIKEIIKEESNWNVYAVSPKGAMGIMQLMPSTAVFLKVNNPYDPEENIDGGIRYLKDLLERFNGNLKLALAAYNAGPNLIELIGRIPNIPETKQYVTRILKRYNKTLPPQSEVASVKKKSLPIRVIFLPDGTILYTNRQDLYIWSKN